MSVSSGGGSKGGSHGGKAKNTFKDMELKENQWAHVLPQEIQMTGGLFECDCGVFL